MRYLWYWFSLLGCIGYSANSLAQRSEIWRERPGTWLLNGGLGVTHYLGDLTEAGNLGYLRLGAAINGAVAYRYSNQLTFRAEGQIYYIRGTQKNTHLEYNNLSFLSLNPDVWVGVQWDFWPASDPNHVIIPYALVGAGLTYMTPRAVFSEQLVSLAPLQTEGVKYNRLPFIARYGLGVPIQTTERFRLNLEATYTHVFSDYLDDVSTVYPDLTKMDPFAAALSDRRLELGLKPNAPGAQRGNSQCRDGYFILSARLVFVINTPSYRNYRRIFPR
ncbi:outer membrane beta-barrel protein [Spirosoma pulveris]